MKKHSTIKIILTSVLTLIIISSTTLAKLPKKEFQAEIMQQRIGVGLDANAYIQTVAEKLIINKPKTQKGIVRNYCDTILSEDMFMVHGEGEDAFLYDPHQSMFMLSLCMTIDPIKYEKMFPYLQNEETTYYKKYELRKFGMPTGSGQSCDLSGSMNNCEFYAYIPNAFDNIINDYINIKQAKIYGISTPDFSSSNIESQINTMTQKLLYGTMLCDKDGEKDSSCYYPKTLKKLKQTLQSVAKLIEKSSTIDYEKIYKDAQSAKSQENCNRMGEIEKGTYNILMCGLVYKEETYNHTQAFLNILYNEILFYRLYLTYHTETLRELYTLSPNLSSSSAAKKQNEHADKMIQLLKRSEDAIELSINMLKDLETYYPVHLGFLLYYEDLINIRQDIVKIITPLTTLYSKLKNAQEKK